MLKYALFFALAAGAAFAQYKSEPSGPPPADLGPFAALLQKDGTRITSDKGIYCELWLRASEPNGPKSAEENITLTNVPTGTLLGVIRFPDKGSDRRGQNLKPGMYTMRYADFPINGDHQGVAPQRDFAILTPLAEDKDPNGSPKFDDLMVMSRKASGTPHPAVLSVWQADDNTVSFEKQGEHDWVLQTKLGSIPFAIILLGKAE